MNWAKPFHILGLAMIFVTHRTIGQSEMTEFACPGSNLVLNCTNLGLIEVTRANYGRFSIEVCNPQSKANWSVNCFDHHAKNIIVKSCNGKALCSLSDEDFEGHESPCPETERYKEAHFTCQKEKEDQKTTKRTRSPIRLQTFRGQMPSSKEFPTDTNSRKRVPITAPPTSTFAQDQEDTSTISHQQLGGAGAERVHFTRAPAIRFSRHSLDTTTVPSFTQSLELPPTPSRLSVVKVVHKSETNIPVYTGFAAPVLSSSSSNSHQQESYPPCLSIRSRGVIWPSTDPGSTARRPCPNNKEQVATWKCLRGPNHWTPSLPDMSKCQASWIKVPTWNTSGEAAFIVDLRDSLRSLKRHLQSNSIYGGDLMLVMGSLDKFLDDFGKSHGRSRDHDKGAQLDLETRTTFIQTISRLLHELSRPSIEATRFEEDKLESLIETVQRILVISSSWSRRQEWDRLGSDNDLHWRSQHLNISTASLKLQGFVNLSHKSVDDVLQSRPYTFCRMHVSSVGSHQKNINRDDGNIPLVYLSMKLPSTFGTHLHQSSRIQGAKIAKRISSTILLINEDSSMFDISISGLREEEDKGARTSSPGCLATVTHVSDGLKHQCQLACSGSRSTSCQCQVVRFAQNGDAAFASTHLRPSSSWRENEKLTETSQVEVERSDINDQVVVLLGCLGATLLLIVAILPFACVLIHLKRAKVQQTSKECVYAGEAFHALDYSTCDGAYQSSLCRFDNTYLTNDGLRHAPSYGSALNSQELPQNTSSQAERLFIMPAGLEYQNALESRAQENLCCNSKRSHLPFLKPEVPLSKKNETNSIDVHQAYSKRGSGKIKEEIGKPTPKLKGPPQY
ncbi:uncharacterized protein LOC131887459 isoform X2 [Tigriopus californicus]|uniref:uncharacterized protein LOC131887459 isoform X2 n=1 Tax=Tigriopus californicus TaxID=6832 RepID=UPI0027DA667C|nr:uncharacterized protein LOC131887459 isoform X2 [Tigriopus californicus]